MTLTKSEVKTLRSLERDAHRLAAHAKRMASKAKTRLLREMKKS